MGIKVKYDLIKIITLAYVINALIEIAAEAIQYKAIIYLTKPLIPLFLMTLYYLNSSKRTAIFFWVMFFSVVTNLLFIPSTQKALFFGVVCFSFHRILLLVLVFKIVKIKDFVPFVLSTIPLLFIFFYLFPSSKIPDDSYYLLVFHSFMAAILGGIAVSCYYMNDTKANSILLTSVILFLALQLVIYIEKYYLSDSKLLFFRPLAMTLNVLAFYLFYRFVIVSEESDND